MNSKIVVVLLLISCVTCYDYIYSLQQVVYFGEKATIDINMVRAECFESKSSIAYNCTIYDDSKIVSVQLDTTNCKFCEFEGDLCNNHNYTVVLYSQSLDHSPSQKYMVVDYRWTENSVCIIIYFVIFSGATIGVIVIAFVLTTCFGILCHYLNKSCRIMEKYYDYRYERRQEKLLRDLENQSINRI